MKISGSSSSRTLMFPGGDDLGTVSSLSRTSNISMDSIITRCNVDIYDQLRVLHWWDHWMRKRRR